ncbi:MAG: hypothetical protein JWP91_3108 [Fibrobacteres bacterium]|nr:hypothetical protein [Fibrobacterota bacterium]
MKPGKIRSLSAGKPPLQTAIRLAAAATGAILWGCMESGSPGSSQSQAMAIRSEAANPFCKIQTHLLVLDEDAIANGKHCRCEEAGSKEPGRHDDPDDDRSKGGGGSGGKGGAGQDEGKDKVEICHIPPGNPGNAKTLSVGAPAVKAHLAHGDYLGTCSCGLDAPRASGKGNGNAASAACMPSFIGNRITLSSFADAVGKEITLPAGTLGDEGWFAITSVRIGWKTAGPDSGDGLRNYAEAGPGLGRPDAKGNRETLLERIPDLTPLRATGLARLQGRSVCAVVLDGDVKMGYDPLVGDIRGPNLGKVAFQVLSVQSDPRGGALPSVTVRILDAEAVCNDPLAPFLEAPRIVSTTEPPDIEKPSCAIQENLVSDPWNTLDTSVWSVDGDQSIEDGLFFAREGAGSAAADWMPPCPVSVDTSTAIRFTNRLSLNSPRQNEFAESGALFLVMTGEEGAFDKFVFVNVGYTMSPSKVFVELFGSDGGKDFDQYEETNIPFTTSQLFNVDLWVLSDAYRVAVAEEMIDTVPLSARLTGAGLFEVGVQQNGGGLRGLVDMTTISKLCKTVAVENRCKRHSPHRGKKKERLGTRCRTRNQYVRMARERIKHCAHPSRSLEILSKMQERPEFD